jgi:hypothetical protein
MSIRKTTLVATVIEYQIVRDEETQNCGSPGSDVASALGTTS